MSATEGVVVCGSVGGNGPLRKGPQISWSCERYARFAQVCAVHSDQASMAYAGIGVGLLLIETTLFA